MNFLQFPSSKKNSFRGNYLRKYDIYLFSLKKLLFLNYLEIVLIFDQNSKLGHINVTKVPHWLIKLIPITNTTSMLNQALEILLWVNMLFFMSRPVFLLNFLIGLSLVRITLFKLDANMVITFILKSKLLVWLHRLIWLLAFMFWFTHRYLSIVSHPA